MSGFANWQRAVTGESVLALRRFVLNRSVGKPPPLEHPVTETLPEVVTLNYVPVKDKSIGIVRDANGRTLVSLSSLSKATGRFPSVLVKFMAARNRPRNCMTNRRATNPVRSRFVEHFMSVEDIRDALNRHQGHGRDINKNEVSEVIDLIAAIPEEQLPPPCVIYRDETLEKQGENTCSTIIVDQVGGRKIERVPFMEDNIIATRDGSNFWVQLSVVCDNLGIHTEPQSSKLRSTHWAKLLDIAYHSDLDNQTRNYTFIDGRTMLGWLLSINPNKITEDKRPKLMRYQNEALDVLERHFFGTKHPAVQNTPVANIDRDNVLASLVGVLGDITNTLAGINGRTSQVEIEVARLHNHIEVVDSRLTEVEAWQRGTVMLSPAPEEKWMSVSLYCRTTNRQYHTGQLIQWGGELKDLMVERGLKVRREHGKQYSVNTYPESILAEYFGDKDGVADAALPIGKETVTS
jgi:hypothetical protein